MSINFKVKLNLDKMEVMLVKNAVVVERTDIFIIDRMQVSHIR